jgi:hypothetical protein
MMILVLFFPEWWELVPDDTEKDCMLADGKEGAQSQEGATFASSCSP